MILSTQHSYAYDELVENFTREELIAMAKSLPFDKQAALALIPSVAGVFESDLKRWLDSPCTKDEKIATYCAAACQGAVAKVLLELVEIAKAKLAKLDSLSSLLKSILEKNSPAILCAMKGQEYRGKCRYCRGDEMAMACECI